MPSLITHDYFGREYLSSNKKTSSWSNDEVEAYLLGNQGPDPFFYAVITPRFYHYTSIGSLIHDKKPTEFLIALSEQSNKLPSAEQPIAQAYIKGYLGHYLLDSTLHPLVYAFEYAIEECGISGISGKDHHEIHAIIESELDEMVLSQKYGLTVNAFRPYKEILRADDASLEIISRLYVQTIYTIFNRTIPYDLFKESVKNFRCVQRLFYSPKGIKRKAISSVEKLFRRHSFYASMSHLAVERNSSFYANDAHLPWANPFTFEIKTDSFWDLFDAAQDRARKSTETVAAIPANNDLAHTITGGLNFSGKPVEAI